MDDFLLRMTEIFKALGDPTRLKVIRLVATKKEYLFVAEIAKKLGITNSAVSQHLKVLKNVNIVKPKRKGYKVYYEINYEMINSFGEDIKKLKKLAFMACDFDGPCNECPQERTCDLTIR